MPLIPDYDIQQLIDRSNPNRLIVRRIDDRTSSVERRNESTSVCDFCGMPQDADTGKNYDADDVEIAVLSAEFVDGSRKSETQLSSGAWGACIRCAILIDANRRASLLDRAITISRKKEQQVFPDSAKLSEYDLREMRRIRILLVAASHDAFWRAKK